MTAKRISARPRSNSPRKVVGGRCLCGEVAFELVRSAGRVMECHCPRCRRAQTSAHAANIFIDFSKFRWLRGEGQVSNYGPPKDWHFGTAFCRQCGSTLPRVVRSVGLVVVPTGTLDGEPGMQPTGHGFVDSKGEWTRSLSDS